MFKKRIFNQALFVLWLVFSIIYVLSASALGQRRGVKIEGNPPKLKIDIQLFKNQYLLREPIWVNFKVANVGNDAGKFYFANIEALVLTDSKGVVYPCSIYIDRGDITISPGQTLEKEFNLLQSYGIPENKFKIHRYLPPEKYTVYYELNHYVMSPSYRVYAKSKIYTFEVLEPKGDELMAMNLLKESNDLYIERKGKESLEKLREIVEKYPNSGYAPYALLASADSLGAFYMLMEKYPDSREAVRAVSSIALVFINKKDKDGYIKAMNSLIKKYPRTAISKEAENQLKQIKDKDFK